MFRILLIPVCCLVIAGSVLANTPPEVSNVVATQRPHTALIDLTFDITDVDGDAAYVTLWYSVDGGISWDQECVTVSGDVGPGIIPEAGLGATWDAGVDFPDFINNEFSLRVYADDGAHLAAWQTIFEDDFNSVTLDPNWILMEGNTDNYVLNGSFMVMDDTPTYADGPLFLYDNIVTDDVIRVTCRLSTLAMSGEVQFVLGVRANDPRPPPIDSDIDQVYAGVMTGNEMAIVKIVGGDGSQLASSIHPAMTSNETRIMECRYENGTISFIARDAGGTEIGSVSATDPSPLVAGKVGFQGEIDGGDNEYIYVHDFKLEKYE